MIKSQVIIVVVVVVEVVLLLLVVVVWYVSLVYNVNSDIITTNSNNTLKRIKAIVDERNRFERDNDGKLDEVFS